MAGSIFDSGLAAVNNTVKALWQREFSAAQDNLPWTDVTTDLGQSKSKAQQFDFFGNPPDMQDVTNDTLRVSGMRRFNYTIQHKLYKAALRVSISDLETDILGQIPPRVQGLARKAAGHPGRLAFDQLEANPTAYDGAAYFADTHAFGAAANCDNTIAGAGTTSTNIAADIKAVRARMMRFEDDHGEPMELAPNVLVIPPELEGAFREVLVPLPVGQNNATTIGVVPPEFGNRWQAAGYTVYTLARLSDTDNWYALHVGEELNPFVYSWISKPQVMNTPTFNDKSATEDDQLVYVVRGHYNVGISLPQYAVRVVN